MTDDELLGALARLKSTMIAVSTGGVRIQEAEYDFAKNFDAVAGELVRRGISNPLPYRDLWDWYGRWSSGDLPSYQSRRRFVSELFNPLIARVQGRISANIEPTGWQRVDRTVTEIRSRLASARTEEQYQAVGLLCRETLISIAQAVYDAHLHPTLDGVAASQTDGKRMLEAYIAATLGGDVNKYVRKHATAALDLAISLQHKRTASFRDAALCVEATASVVNSIAILAGRRDPS